MSKHAAPAKLVAGNWKMNATRAEAEGLLHALVKAGAGKKGVDVVICPPFTQLENARRALHGSGMHLGAQDCSRLTTCAATGDISAAMVKDMGCTYVITGHSERRIHHGESDMVVREKMDSVHRAGMKAILCVGERDPGMSDEQRADAIRIQLANSMSHAANAFNTVIAYEPVWAIGSGLTPSADQITAMHAAIAGFLPAALKGARIIYGGSVKPDNARSILHLKGVDGVLPGGASLKAESFLKIIESTCALAN